MILQQPKGNIIITIGKIGLRQGEANVLWIIVTVGASDLDTDGLIIGGIKYDHRYLVATRDEVSSV